MRCFFLPHSVPAEDSSIFNSDEEGWLMKKSTVFLLSFIFLVFFVRGEQEEEKTKKKQSRLEHHIVVTADKLEQPAEEVSASFTIITDKQIKDKQAITLDEILPYVPGVSMVQYGSIGHLSNLFIRGAELDHNLVLINGIPVNDPASAYFDFSSISLDDIEKIEIVRGPQSTLYGSDALGGVINLISKKGESKNKFNLNLMGGSDTTYKGSFSFSSGSERGNIHLNTSHLSTQGNFENDDYTNTSFSFRGGVKVKEHSLFELFAKYNKTSLGISFSSPQNPSPLRRNSTEESILSLPFSFSVFPAWELKFNLSYFNRKYEFEDPDDPMGYTFSSTYSRTLRLDVQSNLSYSSGIFTFGGEWRNSFINDMDNFGVNFNDQRIETKALFIQNRLNIASDFFLTAGIRLTHHSQFGAHYSPRVTGAYIIKDTKLKASWGSGFRAPRPNELFNWWGNKELKPEVSSSWEVGIEQKLFNSQLLIGFTHFFSEIKNLIVFDFPSWKFKNLDQSRLQGQEFTLSFIPHGNFILQVNYTHLLARDIKENNDLKKRPRHSFNFDFTFTPLERIKLNLRMIYVGRRKDYDELTFSTVDNPAFNRVDFSFRCKLKEKIYLSAKINNLLDKKYQEAYGYPSPDRGAYFGIEFNF